MAWLPTSVPSFPPFQLQTEEETRNFLSSSFGRTITIIAARFLNIALTFDPRLGIKSLYMLHNLNDLAERVKHLDDQHRFSTRFEKQCTQDQKDCIQRIQSALKAIYKNSSPQPQSQPRGPLPPALQGAFEEIDYQQHQHQPPQPQLPHHHQHQHHHQQHHHQQHHHDLQQLPHHHQHHHQYHHHDLQQLPHQHQPPPQPQHYQGYQQPPAAQPQHYQGYQQPPAAQPQHYQGYQQPPAPLPPAPPPLPPAALPPAALPPAALPPAAAPSYQQQQLSKEETAFINELRDFVVPKLGKGPANLSHCIFRNFCRYADRRTTCQNPNCLFFHRVPPEQEKARQFGVWNKVMYYLQLDPPLGFGYRIDDQGR